MDIYVIFYVTKIHVINGERAANVTRRSYSKGSPKETSKDGRAVKIRPIIIIIIIWNGHHRKEEKEDLQEKRV